MHFKTQKMSKSTIYRIIQRAENRLRLKRSGSERKLKIMDTNRKQKLKVMFDQSDKVSQNPSSQIIQM